MTIVTEAWDRILLVGRASTATWLPREEIEPDTLTQIANLANLPPTVHVAVMPDAHKGYGMPIGTVLATKGAVVPYAVGVDIGCGMVAVETDIPVGAAPPEVVKEVLDGVLRSVPVGQPTKADRNAGSHSLRQDSTTLLEWIERRGDTQANKQLRERADRQLGTLGGGNHFIELQADEDGRVWLMLHTGSRGFGHAICTDYHKRALRWCERYYTPLPDKDLAFLSMDTEDGRDYMVDMAYAMRFAVESRARIESMAFMAMSFVFGSSWKPLSRIETHHNFAALEHHLGRDVVVHRKGAVSTRGGVMVTIPGSMQTGSYIGRGIENAMALNTCSHGAGRRLGRNAARRERDNDAPGWSVREAMSEQGIVLVSPEGTDQLDEAAFAYKDIESVMRYQRDLVEPMVKLRPLGVVKG